MAKERFYLSSEPCMAAVTEVYVWRDGTIRVTAEEHIPRKLNLWRPSARGCGNDSHHGYGTGYCGDCEEEGGHGD